jgi:hypothetical protein
MFSAALKLIGTENRNKNGGQGGIRTHGRLPPTAVFKTAALNHSATCPRFDVTPEKNARSIKFDLIFKR